jgi:uncharacterized protein YjbI with pentapeptide repeats
MHSRKNDKPKKPSFTEEQIRAKAYQIWQKNKEFSAEEIWNAAKKALQSEQRFWLLKVFWQWTGFGEKKLWDFLQLLIVPIVLAGTGFVLQQFAKEGDQKAALDKAQQETLVKYLEQMSEAIKTDNLLTTKPDKNTFLVAQIRTITALQSLNSDRQLAVFFFLRAANLLNRNDLDHSELKRKKPRATSQHQSSHGLLHNAQMPNINLRHANLTDADLSGANFGGANFSGAILMGSDLKGANFINADLRGTYLINADLRGASLTLSNLSGSFLIDADLRDTDLRFANFKGADLRGVDLRGAKFCQTMLSDGKLSNQNC